MAAPAERPKVAGVIFLLLAGLAIAAITLQTWWAISQDRSITFKSEYENGLVAVRLLEEHATQTLREADGNLSTVINAIQSISRERELNDDIIRELITKAQPFNKVLKALQYVNPSGKAFVSTIDYPAYQVDADERTYIPLLLKHPEIRHAVIGHPFQRFYDTELVVLKTVLSSSASPLIKNMWVKKSDSHRLSRICSIRLLKAASVTVSFLMKKIR